MSAFIKVRNPNKIIDPKHVVITILVSEIKTVSLTKLCRGSAKCYQVKYRAEIFYQRCQKEVKDFLSFGFVAVIWTWWQRASKIKYFPSKYCNIVRQKKVCWADDMSLMRLRAKKDSDCFIRHLPIFYLVGFWWDDLFRLQHGWDRSQLKQRRPSSET